MKALKNAEINKNIIENILWNKFWIDFWSTENAFKMNGPAALTRGKWDDNDNGILNESWSREQSSSVRSRFYTYGSELACFRADTAVDTDSDNWRRRRNRRQGGRSLWIEKRNRRRCLTELNRTKEDGRYDGIATAVWQRDKIGRSGGWRRGYLCVRGTGINVANNPLRRESKLRKRRKERKRLIIPTSPHTAMLRDWSAFIVAW